MPTHHGLKSDDHDGAEDRGEPSIQPHQKQAIPIAEQGPAAQPSPQHNQLLSQCGVLDLLPRANAARPDVPVIMITAYGDAETTGKVLAGGAEALLTKPMDFALLRNEIDTRVGCAA